MINSLRVFLVCVLYVFVQSASHEECQCSDNLSKWEKEEPLDSAVTTGMSSTTSNGYGYTETGVAASEKAASEDLERVKKLMKYFMGAQVTGMDRYVLAAIASRESRAGNVLDANGWGDHGNGYGVMQIDKRSHTIDESFGPRSLEHIQQAAYILKAAHDQVARRFPFWPAEAKLRGAIAAYNFGVSNVQTLDGIDVGTTGGDYSSDVIARAQYFKRNGL